MANGPFAATLARPSSLRNSSDPIAPATSRATTSRNAHRIQERSQNRISNQAICRITPRDLAPRSDRGEEHVLEARLGRSEAFFRRQVAIHVEQSLTLHEPARDDSVASLELGQVRLGDRALPDPAGQPGDGVARATLVEQPSAVDDGHPG